MSKLEPPKTIEELPAFIDGLKAQLDETYAALIQSRRTITDLCQQWALMVHSKHHDPTIFWTECQDEFCSSVRDVYQHLLKIKPGVPHETSSFSFSDNT